MEENVKKELDQIVSGIDSKIEKANNDTIHNVVENISVKAEEVASEKVGNLETKMNERLDAIEVGYKKSFEDSKPLTFKSALTKALESDAFEKVQKGYSRSARFDVKAGDMTTGNSFTGEVIPAQRVAGYFYDPSRPVHIRNLISQGSTVSDVIRFVKESAYDNGAAAVAEGGTLAQSDFDMTATDVNVRKIGTYLRVTEEMLSDTPQLTSYISTRGPEKLLRHEDYQLLSGSGVAPNLSGIITDGANFDTTSGGAFYHAVESANQFDVLIAAINQMALLNYVPDTILLHPTDFHKILLLKDTTNNYIKDQVYAGLQPSFAGTKVVVNNAVTAGTFVVGNFSQGSQLWIRDNVNVEFFREDGTNVRDGYVTVRISERIALANYLPNAYVDGTFSTAQAALETA